MSFYRAKLRATDRNVYYDNRLTTFTNPPVYQGNLRVENDLDVCGNLSVGKNLSAYNFYARGNYYLNDYLLVPYGTVIQSAAIAVPAGWLLCDGASVNRFTYANLFGALGYSYGGRDNSFNLPDLRGRSTVGAGAGAGLTARALGATGGEENHTLTVPEMPSHSHTSNATGGSGNYGLIYTDGANTATGTDYSATEPNVWHAAGALNIDSTGGGNPHNNMQPFFVLNYLIKF